MGKLYLGIDLGGTKIAAGLVNDGKVLRTIILPTRASEGRETVLSQLRQVIDTLMFQKDSSSLASRDSRGKSAAEKVPKLSGIAIGVPGLYRGTKIVSLSHIPSLNGVDLKRALHITVPMVIENDARSFVLGEWRRGAARGKKNVLGITLGTGVGGGIIIDGKLLRGAHGSAGEWGHTISDVALNTLAHDSISPIMRTAGGTAGGKIISGVGDFTFSKDSLVPLQWESFLSGPGIIERHRLRGGVEKTVGEIWTSTSPLAQTTRDEVVRMLAIFCTNLRCIFDPDCIIIGGGIGDIPGLVSSTSKYLKAMGVHVVVKKSALGTDAAIIGATTVFEK